MATKNFTDFLPDVHPEVLGCPESMMINAIRNATDELCMKTDYWQSTLDAMNAVANMAVYSIDVPSNANLARVLSVMHNDIVLQPAPEDWLDKYKADWADSYGAQASYYHVTYADTELKLIPYPDVAGTGNIEIRVSLRPSPTSTNTDSLLFNEWHEGIAHGALARLLALPGKPWSHPETAMYHRRLFQEAIADASTNIRRGRTRHSLKVTHQFFGA